jgi:aminopeptidase S
MWRQAAAMLVAPASSRPRDVVRHAAEEVLVLISTSGLTGSRIRLLFMGISVILVAAACGTGVQEPPPTAPPPTAPTSAAPQATRSKASAPARPPVRQLSGQVSDARALRHMRALQKIADEHGGNRATGTSGYEASVGYVVGVLRGAGFKVSTPTYEVSGDDDETGTGRNVIAQTRTGDRGRVVMIGAHLDSVSEGPGIVDNGSGVASLLEIATRLGVEPSVQKHGAVRVLRR